MRSINGLPACHCEVTAEAIPLRTCSADRWGIASGPGTAPRNDNQCQAMTIARESYLILKIQIYCRGSQD